MPIKRYNGSSWDVVAGAGVQGATGASGNTTVNSKGDLLTFDTAAARLPVGTNGQTLVADSSTSTGLRWQDTFVAGKNKIINGDFNIWQRGTSFTPSAGTFTYTSDRWATVVPAGTTVSRQTFTPGTAPVAGYEGTYYFNQTITANAQNYETVQRIEDARTFAGQTVTLSFWARSTVGAQPFNVALYQNFGTGGSPSSLVQVGVSTYTPTSSWQRFSFTFSVPSIAGKTFGTNNDSFLWVRILQYTTTATNTSIDIWGVQLEAGSVATPFTTATGTIQGELAACQRYYWRSTGPNAYSLVGSGFARAATECWFDIPFPVTMRTSPTSADFSSLMAYDATTIYGISTIGVSTGNSGINHAQVIASSMSGLTSNRPYFLQLNNNAAGFIGFNAEL